MVIFFQEFIQEKMSYTTWSYFILLAVSLVVFYIISKKKQWVVLLCASVLFYYQAVGRDWKVCAVFFATIVFSYFGGIVLSKKKKRIYLFVIIIFSIAPLLIVKTTAFLVHKDSLIVPLGLSFYSLQIYAYLYDIYHEKTIAEKNIFRYILFIAFFPHIMQGPIPRHEVLRKELYSEKSFNATLFTRGFLLILWGFFLKYLIAERAAIFVNTVFQNTAMYQGMFVLIAGVLYSIQLYTDFLSCVCMSRGAAELFGIHIEDNFQRPYLACSIKDFWRRWHISLSSWLRDYIYIPCGGSRHGSFRKYINIMITFLVSGLWHGNGIQFLLWGGMHGVYQITGDLTHPLRERGKQLLGIEKDLKANKWWQRGITFFFVMIAWIIFRANSLQDGIRMVWSIFSVPNLWVLWDDSLLNLGLEWKQWGLLLISLCILLKVELSQERKICIRDKILSQPLIVRWIIYLSAIAVIVVFGIYGYGYNAGDFIYKGF